MHQNGIGAGLCPGPYNRAYNAPSDPLAKFRDRNTERKMENSTGIKDEKRRGERERKTEEKESGHRGGEKRIAINGR